MDVAVLAEIRNWLTFALVFVGGVITYRTYARGQQQRCLENGFRLVAMFWEVVTSEDVERWTELFHAASESAGAKRGHFVWDGGGGEDQWSFSSLFGEGPPDEGSVERMAESFDLIAQEAMQGAADLRIVYFQLGQLMDTVHDWLVTIPNEFGDRSFIETHFPSFHALYATKTVDTSWTSRTFTHSS